MKMQAYNDVWDALSDTPEEAENIKIRSGLMMAISERLENLDGPQAAKAKRLGLTRPRLNDLLQGRIRQFSLDALITIAVNAGLKISLRAGPRGTAGKMLY